MSDLIERLRDKKRLRAAHGLTGWVLADESLHTEAADEIERLTAALQHEADCVEAAKAEIERLTDENRRLRADLLAGRNVVNAGLTIHTLTIERDELRGQLAEAWAEREAMANVLPGYYYMDPPDGGDVSVLEQLRRMAKDAERYRWLRANREFCVATYPEGEWVIPAGMVFLGYSNPDADSWIDAAMELTRPAEES